MPARRPVCSTGSGIPKQPGDVCVQANKHSCSKAKHSYRNALLHHLLMCPGGLLRVVSLHARLQQGVEGDSVWLEAC